MTVIRKFFMVAVLFSLVCSASLAAQGGLLSRGKLQKHASTLYRTLAAGIFGFATFCGAQVCLPQALAAAEQVNNQRIEQTAEVRQDAEENAGEVHDRDYVQEILTTTQAFDSQWPYNPLINHAVKDLWLASYYGSLEEIKSLVGQHQYDTYYIGDDRYALLEAMDYAIIGGHLDVVKYLHTQDVMGAPIGQQGGDYLRLAAKHQRWEIMHFLGNNGASFKGAIKYAAETQSETVLFHLLTAGADNNYLNSMNSIMRVKARDGELKAVKFLHTYGADDLNGAMIEAASGRELDVIKYLRVEGADALNEALVKTVGYASIEGVGQGYRDFRFSNR